MLRMRLAELMLNRNSEALEVCYRSVRPNKELVDAIQTITSVTLQLSIATFIGTTQVLNASSKH